MTEKKIYYYSFFDDKEEKNYIKSSLEHHQITELIGEFEKSHQEYLNTDFVDFLKSRDPETDVIEITRIYY